MEKETKYREAKIWVHDNGYYVGFSNYRGKSPSKEGTKVAKTLEDVHKILKDNLIGLVD